MPAIKCPAPPVDIQARAEPCATGAAGCRAGAGSQPAALGHKWGPHVAAFSEQRGGTSLQ